MRVDGGFVSQEHLFVGAMCDPHDIDVVKLRPAFAPIRVRHDVMSAHLAPRVDFAARRHRPVEQRIVTSHLFAIGHGLDVL